VLRRKKGRYVARREGETAAIADNRGTPAFELSKLSGRKNKTSPIGRERKEGNRWKEAKEKKGKPRNRTKKVVRLRRVHGSSLSSGKKERVQMHGEGSHRRTISRGGKKEKNGGE